MSRGRKVLLSGLSVLVLAAATVLIPGSPARTFVHGLRGLECTTWFDDGDGETLAAYGDSITHANSETQFGLHGTQSWYSHLICSDRFVDGRNAGVPSETSEQILDRLRADDPDAEVIVIEAGTNDLRLGLPLEETMANLTAAVEEAERGASVVVLTTVQPWTGTDATALNAAVRELAERTGTPVADFAGVLSTPGNTIDGVHPTPEAARKLADAVATAAA